MRRTGLIALALGVAALGGAVIWAANPMPAEPEPLAFLVAKHLLENQGARVILDGRVTRVDLRCIVAETGPD